MTRRLWLFAAVLTLMAVPALARRRAVTPGHGMHCVSATLVRATYAELLAADDGHIYFIDEFANLARVPKNGGDVEFITNPFDDGLRDWLPMSMTVDATHVYIGALPVEAIFAPLPGAILTVPKNGGSVSVLMSGVVTPVEVTADATHLYWAAAGTFDFHDGSIAPDGKIERMSKDGAVRETLAGSLSAPLGLALDGNDIYFGQSGLAEGDPSVGLHRVAKSGGGVVTIHDDVAVGPVAIAGDTIVMYGEAETANGILATAKTGEAPVRTLYSSDRLGTGLHVAGGRVYFLQEAQGPGGELAWVSIDAPAEPVVVRGETDGDDFLLDGCAAIVNTVDGHLIRTPR